MVNDPTQRRLTFDDNHRRARYGRDDKRRQPGRLAGVVERVTPLAMDADCLEGVTHLLILLQATLPNRRPPNLQELKHFLLKTLTPKL